MKSKIGALAVLCAMTLTLLAGCDSGASNAETDTATAFLEQLYTVQEYRAAPLSQEEVDALLAEFAPYMTQDALDTLILNGYILDPSIAAQEIGATIAVLEVSYEPMPDTEGYYKYTAVLEVTTPEGVREIDAPGKIILNEEGLVSYFAPSTSVAMQLKDL